MKTSTVRGLLITTMMLALAASATAQDDPFAPQTDPMKMWNFTVGIFFPAPSGLLHSDLQIGIEHEHPANEIIPGMPGNLTLSVDYSRIRTTFGDSNKSQGLMPIFVNWKTHDALGGEGQQSVFWGAGVGTYWAFDTIPDMNLHSGMQFAYNLAMGYNFTPSWFLEGRYMAGVNPATDRLVTADLGYSF